MKTLIIVRHAKSDWTSGSNSDFERPLNNRGHKDAPLMGNLLKEKGINPDLIISSPANRAKTTAKYFAEKLGYSEDNIIFKDRIYNGSHSDVIKIVNSIDNKNNISIIFGHNPDVTSLVTVLSDEYLDNMPTCGVACIDFEIDDWSKISDNREGKLRFFEYPKLY